MNFTVDRKALNAAMKVVLPAVPKTGGALPVLSGVKLDAADNMLTLTATDLDLAVENTIDCEVAEPGATVLPAQLLARIVGKFAGDTLTLRSDRKDPEAEITSGDSVASLLMLPADEWPRQPDIDGEVLELGPDELDGLRRIVHAIGTDYARPFLTTVCFDLERMAASDGYRLATFAFVQPRTGDTVLVPGRVLQSILATNPATITATIDAMRARFTSGAVTWSTRLVQADYFDYSRLYPSSFSHAITVDSDELRNSLGRVEALGDDGTTPVPVKLSRDGGKLMVQRARVDVGSIVDTIPVDSSIDFPLGVDGGRLDDLLTAHGPGDVTIKLNDANKPLVTEAGRLSLLLMPWRLT